MQHYLLPDDAIELVMNFTSNRKLSFTFENNIEAPRSYNSELPQGSPISPILFLIYAQAMLNPILQAGAVDAFYINDDAMLRTVSSQENVVRFLIDQTHPRMERGVVLNLPYDFAKSSLIHLFSKFSYLVPKNYEDLKHLPKAIINETTTIEPSRTLRHLGIQINR